mmetsp:Transcript_32658/g.63712  ORF Transcript_32658/g.63712 Transcript_32658/m.63712 type:complete len:260 (+) Transcript_32658:2-781(+)
MASPLAVLAFAASLLPAFAKPAFTRPQHFTGYRNNFVNAGTPRVLRAMVLRNQKQPVLTKPRCTKDSKAGAGVQQETPRRVFMRELVLGGLSVGYSMSQVARADDELNSAEDEELEDEDVSVEEPKGPETFTIQQIIETIKDDIVTHQYLITGDLNDRIYSEKCEFKQPLEAIKGTKNYKDKVGKLWDASKSKVELLEVEQDDATHIVATWRITGALRNLFLLGGGKLAPFIGRTRYTLDSETNKILYSLEEWESTPWG